MELNELVKRAHETAVRHGFWNPAPEIGTNIAWIHSELSEAWEEVRAGNPVLYYNVRRKMDYNDKRPYKHGKVF